MGAISDSGQLLRKSIYVGINLQDILYGIELVLFFKTIHALLSHPGERTRSDVFYTLFSSAMLFVSTIWVSTQAIFYHKMWLPDADFPDGPGALWMAKFWGWYMNLGMMSPIVLQLMTDALMLYRCWMLWGNYRVIIIPLILWAGALVLGIVTSWTSIVTGGIYFHENVTQISLAYYGVAVFLAATLTCMICYRLVRHGRLVKEHLGREFASTYFAVVALVIESVLPCTLCSTAFLISLGMKSQTMALFGYIHTLLLCILPQILILRVATLRLSNNTGVVQPPSAVKFSPMTASEADYIASNLSALTRESSIQHNTNRV